MVIHRSGRALTGARGFVICWASNTARACPRPFRGRWDHGICDLYIICLASRPTGKLRHNIERIGELILDKGNILLFAFL